MIPSTNDLRPVMNAPSRWAVRVLAWTALGLSAYLAFTSLSHAKVVGCAGGETVDCDSVLSSQWSMWLGLPVAVGGLACYAALAGLSMLLGARTAAARRWIGSLVLMLAVVAGGAGLWFIALQFLVIHKICVFCMGVHACGVLLAALVLWAMVIHPAMVRRSLSTKDAERQLLVLQSARPATSAEDSLPTSGLCAAPSLRLALGGALAMLTALVVGQVYFPPQTFSTVSSEGLAQTIEMDAADQPATTAPPPAKEPGDTRLTAGAGKEAARPTIKKPAAARRPTHTTGTADDLFAQLDQPADAGDAADLFAEVTDKTPDKRSATEVKQSATASGEAPPAAEENNQPRSDRPEANVDQSGASGDAAELFAAVTDEPATATSATAGGEKSADRPAAGPGRPEPVMPVSASGDHLGTTTADWKNIAANPPELNGAKQQRMVSLLNGRLKLDMYKHPVLGPVDAPNVIVELMSYDCPHCRRMHEMIEEGLKRYDGQLAIVEMVVPLEMGCNKYITSAKYSHPGSCELTRLALGIAAIDRTAFPEFHNWLLSDPAKLPSPEDATAYAHQLVDRDRLLAVMQGDDLKKQIDGYVELYKVLEDLSERQHKAFGLPVQILGRTVVSGDLATAGELYWTWEKNLSLRPHVSVTAEQTSSNP
jgi:uncharacterized membrane protein/thiol-disulfide isomerase/thioredoxin